MSHLAPGSSFSCSQFPFGLPLAKCLDVGGLSLTALAQILITNLAYLISSTDLFDFDSQNRSGDPSQPLSAQLRLTTSLAQLHIKSCSSREPREHEEVSGIRISRGLFGQPRIE